MYYADINRRYTETVAAHLANGYIINTRTMNGGQGDYAHIDLTDGTQVIRIMVDTIHEWKDGPLDGIAIIVGRADSEVEPNGENDYYTLWNHRLDVISKECFYEIGTDRHNRKFYGTREEAIAAQQVKLQRYIAKNSGHQTEKHGVLRYHLGCL